jgi:uncharacterized protein (TIGR02145 family)
MKINNRIFTILFIGGFSLLNSCSKENISPNKFFNFNGTWKGFSTILPTGTCTIMKSILYRELDMLVEPDGTLTITEERIFNDEDSVFMPAVSITWKGKINNDLTVQLYKYQAQQCGGNNLIDSILYTSKILKKDGQYILTMKNEEVWCPSMDCSFVLDYYLTKEIVGEDSFIASANSGCESFSVKDPRDGRIYKIIQIGSQCWFAENLRYSGSIPEITEDEEWKAIWNNGYPIDKPAWCYLYNDPANDSIYGKLYNWYAVKSESICPPGWHIPTDTEWYILTHYLGGTNLAGGKMKSMDGWDLPNNESNNSSGFSGLPGGYRRSTAGFIDRGISGYWWSSTEVRTTAFFRSLYYWDGIVYRVNYGKSAGMACRCVKD